jgi:thiamine-phosphate pyrophosphorylase
MSGERRARLRGAFGLCPLYAILDESLFVAHQPIELSDTWLDAGVKAIQLRAKRLPAQEYLTLANQLATKCRRAGALLIVNDQAEIALRAGADGLHLGDGDQSIVEARQMLPSLIIGRTVRTPEAALQAQLEGADYLGCGSVFASCTKPELPVIGLEGLRAVCHSARIPVAAIGGITPETIGQCLAAGASAICMISGLNSPDNFDRALKAARHTTDGH